MTCGNAVAFVVGGNASAGDAIGDCVSWKIELSVVESIVDEMKEGFALFSGLSMAFCINIKQLRSL